MIMIHIINKLKLQHIQLKHIYTDINKHRYTNRHIDTNNIQTLVVAYRYSSTITTTLTTTYTLINTEADMGTYVNIVYRDRYIETSWRQ